MKSKIFLFSIIIISSCQSKDADKRLATPSSTQNKFVFGEVVEKELNASINLPGELKPFEIVQIFPKVNGFIKSISVDMGSLVHKGDVLIQLEAPEVEQQYLSAKSRWLQTYALQLASKDHYERLLSTSKTPGTVAAYDLEMAKEKMMADSAVADAEKSNYKSLEATRSYLTILAPFDGVITERNVHPGALVGPGMKSEDKPLLVLEKESVLRLSFTVPEMYTSQLSSQSAVSFSVSTLPGKFFKGQISRSAGALNTKFRSEIVEVDVENGKGLLKPGMYAEILLPIKRKGPSLVVPQSAIVTSTERKFVITNKDGKANWIDVESGNSQNDSTEIFGDIHVGDRVMLHASDEIKPGTALQ